MLLTADEAKEKTCPFMTYCCNDAGVVQHHEAPIYVPGRCITSDCMAWRWAPLPVGGREWTEAVKKAAEEIGDTTASRRKAVRFVAENRERFGLPTKQTRGWCARLANTKPEV